MKMDKKSKVAKMPDVASYSSVNESMPDSEISDDSIEKDSEVTSMLNEEKSLKMIEPVASTDESGKKGRTKGQRSMRGRQYSGSSHSSNVSSVSRNELTEHSGIIFAVGSRLRVRDFTKQWYDAKIIKVNEETSEIKIHFDRWNSRYDNWFKMDSPDIQAISPERLKKSNVNRKYEVNEEVLAKWKDCNMYPAKVTSILDNACYKVLFYDGLVSKVQSSNIEPLPDGYVEKLNFPPVNDPKHGKKDSSHDNVQVENARAFHTAIHAVASKEFVIEEDHNHFKCQVPDCAKSFRKEKLLKSHMKHYHDMNYDPNNVIVLSSKSSDECKLPLGSRGKKFIESAPLQKEIFIKKTSQSVKVTQKRKGDVEKKDVSSSEQLTKKIKSIRTTAVPQNLNLPQRSSSRRISLPAKLAGDEICLLQQPVRRDRTCSTYEKSVEKHEVAKISASKSSKIKEKSQKIDNSEKSKKNNVSIEPESLSICDSASKKESIRSLEPIRRMMTERLLDPMKLDRLITLVSTSRPKDKSTSSVDKKSDVHLPKIAITKNTCAKDGVKPKELVHPVVTKDPAKIGHQVCAKIYSDKSEVDSTICTDSEKELNDILKLGVNEESFVKGQSGAHSEILLSEPGAKIPESGAEGPSCENLALRDKQSTSVTNNDEVKVSPVKELETDGEVCSPSLPIEKETISIANEITALVSQTTESEPTAVSTALAANDLSSEPNAELNTLIVKSSEGKHSESNEGSKDSCDAIHETDLNLEKPMYRKLDTVVSASTHIPGHIMRTRWKEAILEKEKAAQSVGSHVMRTRKKSEKLAAVEEQFQQRIMIGPKKTDSLFVPKLNKRRQFFSQPREKTTSFKQEHARTNTFSNEPHHYNLNSGRAVSSVVKGVKTDSLSFSNVDVKMRKNYRAASSTHSKAANDDIVHCVCDSTEEEGLMIQCEVCLTWQHGFCFNIHDEKAVPEKYVCSSCLEPKGLRESCRYKHDLDYYKKGQLPSFSFPNQPDFLKNPIVNPNSLMKTQQCIASIINVKNVLHSVGHRINIVSAENHPDLQLFEKSAAEKLIDEAEIKDKELAVHDGSAGSCNIGSILSSQKGLPLNSKSSSKNLITFDHSYYFPAADILDLNAMPLITEEEIKSDVGTLSCVDTPTSLLVSEKLVPKESDFLQSKLTLPFSISDLVHVDEGVNDSASGTVDNGPEMCSDTKSMQVENSFPSASDSASIIAGSIKTLGACSNLQSCSLDSSSDESSRNLRVCSASVTSKKPELEIKDGEMAVIHLNSGSVSNNTESLAFLFNEGEDNSDVPISLIKQSNSPRDIFNDVNISSKCKRTLMDDVKSSLNATTTELDKVEEFVDALEEEELVRKAKIELQRRFLKEANQVPVHHRLKRLLGDLDVVEQILKF